MRKLIAGYKDIELFTQLLKQPRALNKQPETYDNLVVVKPWGYELQLFSNADTSTWLACLHPGQSVSMHCHQKKSVFFVPLSNGLIFKTLDGAEPFEEYISIDKYVFHSQENVSDDEAFFLECEWPPDKADLIRYKDRYGRENQGYESSLSMISYDLAVEKFKIPAQFQMMRK